MTATFKLYSDAAMTTELASPLNFSQLADGSSAPQDVVVYLGSTVAGKQLRNNASPGTGQISATLVSSGAGGTTPVTDFKLAASQAGLASAVAGAALNLGTQLISGTAQPIWIRCQDSTHVVATNTNVSMKLLGLREEAYP